MTTPQRFVVRVWHGFETPARRALLLDAAARLDPALGVAFRFACEGERGTEQEDVSHAHCIALDDPAPTVPLLAIARDGRPLLLVVDADHPVARLACEHGCAITVPEDAPEALADAVRALVEDPLRASLMGLRARWLELRSTQPGAAKAVDDAGAGR